METPKAKPRMIIGWRHADAANAKLRGRKTHAPKAVAGKANEVRIAEPQAETA